jgi:hypothetical protein
MVDKFDMVDMVVMVDKVDKFHMVDMGKVVGCLLSCTRFPILAGVNSGMCSYCIPVAHEATPSLYFH